MNIFNLPDLGEGLPDAEINEWHVKVGDVVSTDQPLVSMETAKAVVDVPAPQDGVVAKLYGQPGDIIQTGNPLIAFESSEAAQTKEASTTASSSSATVVGNLQTLDETVEDKFIIGSGNNQNVSRPKATPYVRALATKQGIDLSNIEGTGAYGVITKADLNLKSSNISTTSAKSSASVPNGFEALRGVRRAMVQSMSLSHQQVVPVTLTDDADIHLWAEGNDITARLVKAVCHAAQVEPALNAWYDHDSQSRKLHDDVHLGLAVDSQEGLFVPVIKEAQTKDAASLRAEVNRFKKGVSERNLPPEDLSGATITLSNFGKFAGRYASPVIVPPMVAIIAVGRLMETLKMVDGKLESHRIVPLSLTFDHRAATGGEACRFLGALIASLEMEN